MKRSRKLIGFLFPPFMAITALSVLAVSWYTSEIFKDIFLQRTQSDLFTQARLLAAQVDRWLVISADTDMDPLCKAVTRGTDTRLTVILPDGRVICDSVETPAHMENHGNRPEMRSALSGAPGSSIRLSGTLRQPMMYTAIPILRLGQVEAVLRTALPISAIDEEIRSMRLRIAGVGLLIAFVASAVCLYVSRQIGRPIQALRQGAVRFAEGDLALRLRSPETLEFEGLAQAMNQMAEHLQNRIDTAVRQRNEMAAVLSSMMEGVLAVDLNERVIRMNETAGRMIGVDPERLDGRSLQELIRNTDLVRRVQENLSEGTNTDGDIVFRGAEERTLNIRCTALRDAEGGRFGALMVLNDVTLLRRLENMRRDFAVNVSHELKTPLTAVKGFVETLIHNDVEDPEEVRRFLGIIQRHVERLSVIIENLMQLSRIEREDELGRLRFQDHCLADLLRTAMDLCLEKAREKDMAMDLTCDPSLTVKADRALMEQAFVNLIDNAVKYSPKDSRLSVRADGSETGIRIQFQDQGLGIPQKHLPRLFERFYRVDAARSRKLGGTGLGLAIVKHIVQAHRGKVSVESELGRGSTFTVELPVG